MKGFLKFLAIVALASVIFRLWNTPWYQVDPPPEEFDFDPANASLQSSLIRLKFEGAVKVDRPKVQRPGSARFIIRFLRGGREVLSLGAHDKTVFSCSNDTLYFSDFEPSANGCSISAYDLSYGMRLWQTQLEAVYCPGHFFYQNSVMLTLTDRTLIISGCESYGDYIEILDRRTGTPMAHKVYRTGFLPLSEGQPPFIGGPRR